MGSFWHPFANMAETRRQGEVVFVEGDGCTLVDANGRSYFDATAGLWYCAVGHGRKRIASAIAAQAERLAACTCFDVYASDTTLRLADRLASFVPVEKPQIFLTSGGSDGVETAAKVIRRFFTLRNQPDKTVMLARAQAYHGMHAYGTSLAGIPGNREGFGSLVADVGNVEAFDPEALERRIAEIGPERVAASLPSPLSGLAASFRRRLTIFVMSPRSAGGMESSLLLTRSSPDWDEPGVGSRANAMESNPTC